MPKFINEPPTSRVYMRVPTPAYEEIMAYANEYKWSPMNFMEASMLIGARVLARQLDPERFMSADQVGALGSAMARAVAEAMGVSEAEAAERLQQAKSEE